MYYRYSDFCSRPQKWKLTTSHMTKYRLYSCWTKQNVNPCILSGRVSPTFLCYMEQDLKPMHFEWEIFFDFRRGGGIQCANCYDIKTKSEKVVKGFGHILTNPIYLCISIDIQLFSSREGNRRV